VRIFYSSKLLHLFDIIYIVTIMHCFKKSYYFIHNFLLLYKMIIVSNDVVVIMIIQVVHSNFEQKK
jgi:hypothetical protein